MLLFTQLENRPSVLVGTANVLQPMRCINPTKHRLWSKDSVNDALSIPALSVSLRDSRATGRGSRGCGRGFHLDLMMQRLAVLRLDARTNVLLRLGGICAGLQRASSIVAAGDAILQ
jgi:hypothetical protein